MGTTGVRHHPKFQDPVEFSPTYFALLLSVHYLFDIHNSKKKSSLVCLAYNFKTIFKIKSHSQLKFVLVQQILVC